MKYFYIFIILLYSCENINNEYPQIVIKNNLEQIYDQARWLVYQSSYNCRGVGYRNQHNPVFDSTIYALECDLSLYKYEVSEDTMSFIFVFKEPKEHLDVFPKGNFIDKIMYIKSDNYYYRLNADDAFNAPIDSCLKVIRDYEQNENNKWSLKNDSISFSNFLKETKIRLNPWLYNEAKKRRIIN